MSDPDAQNRLVRDAVLQWAHSRGLGTIMSFDVKHDLWRISLLCREGDLDITVTVGGQATVSGYANRASSPRGITAVLNHIEQERKQETESCR